jgi:hypothetical protein
VPDLTRVARAPTTATNGTSDAASANAFVPELPLGEECVAPPVPVSYTRFSTTQTSTPSIT